MNRWLPMYRLVLFLCLLLVLSPMMAHAQATQPPCAVDLIVQTNDILSDLADFYLGRASLYTLIVEATNARATVDESYTLITDPDTLVTGTKLCIPPREDGLTTAPATALPPTPTATTASTPTAPTAPLPTVTPSPTPIAKQKVTAVTNPQPRLFAPALKPGSDLHPLAIAAMRLRQYPGSPLIIEAQLESGPNYYRYLTSYQSEGLKNYALLTIPGDPQPKSGWPVIVFNHGYIPPEEYRTTERYVAYVDYFARNGYIVFRPDYRGHGFSEGEALGGYGYPDYVVDVLNAVSTIKRYPAADPERIGMWGHSMGGYITLRCMVISKEIKAGVIWAGVVASYPDLVTKWQGKSIANIPEVARRWRVELAEQYGSPEENPTFWASISANSFLDDLSGPIQLHHGTADEDVPVEFSATLYDELTAADQTAEYYEYEGDNHNISENFKLAAKHSLDFFDKYVEGAETP